MVFRLVVILAVTALASRAAADETANDSDNDDFRPRFNRARLMALNHDQPDRFHHSGEFGTTRKPVTPKHPKYQPLPTDYVQRNAREKQNFLFKRIEQTAYPTGVQLPTVPAADKSQLKDTAFLIQTFTHTSDEKLEGRPRLTHEYGVVGKAQLQMFDNSPYTGIFQSPGATYCLARLSVTVPQDPKYIAPNIALKVLIDGKPSVNFHSFNTLEGQPLPDRNFFRKSLTNVVLDPFEPVIKGIQVTFNQALTRLPPSPDRPESATLLGLYEQAAITPTGDSVEEIVAPWRIEWVPNPELTERFENRTDDFRHPLMEIPENTVLYDIVLYRQRDQSTGQFVGRLISRSRFIASEYGDEVLFFQHAQKRWQA